MHSVHSGSVAVGGPQTNSSSLQGGLLSAKATPKPNTYRSNLRNRGSYELGPIRLTMQARVNPRPLFGILAERTGLIAKKGPPTTVLAVGLVLAGSAIRWPGRR